MCYLIKLGSHLTTRHYKYLQEQISTVFTNTEIHVFVHYIACKDNLWYFQVYRHISGVIAVMYGNKYKVESILLSTLCPMVWNRTNKYKNVSILTVTKGFESFLGIKVYVFQFIFMAVQLIELTGVFTTTKVVSVILLNEVLISQLGSPNLLEAKPILVSKCRYLMIWDLSCKHGHNRTYYW